LSNSQSLDPITEDSVPVLYKQCEDVYNLMIKNKSLSEYNGKPIYRGHLTKEIEEELGLTTSQYSRIVKALSEMQCIYQIKRGAASVPSEWALIGPPELTTFQAVTANQRKRHNSSFTAIKQRLNDLIEVLKQVDIQLREEIRKLDERIAHIEDHLQLIDSEPEPEPEPKLEPEPEPELELDENKDNFYGETGWSSE